MKDFWSKGLDEYWMSMDSFIHITQRPNTMKPQPSYRVSPGGQLKIPQTLTQKVPWCHGKAEMVETHAEKEAFTPNFTGLLPPGQVNSCLSSMSNISS